MDAKQHEIDKLSADLKASKANSDDLQAKLTADQNDLAALKDQLVKNGVSSKEQVDKLQQALADYKQRADQLAAMEQRYRDLRSRLEKLANVGVKFVVRNNRMVIQLPGDILFDSGKDELKKDGKDVLLQVADVIRSDKDLYARNFQVAGHTDDAKYPAGGPFKDNWGLSLARARQVLLYLIASNPNAPGKPTPAKLPNAKEVGGGLDPKRWAAAGYGDTDPQAGTVEAQTPDEMKKNRRVELVLQPNVDEMLNLNTIK